MSTEKETIQNNKDKSRNTRITAIIMAALTLLLPMVTFVAGEASSAGEDGVENGAADERSEEASDSDSTGAGESDEAVAESDESGESSDESEDERWYEGNTESAPDELDSDGDGLSDECEELSGLDPLSYDDPLDDFDQDFLSNQAECQWGTDLNDPDSDGDGIPDGEDASTASLDKSGVAIEPSRECMREEWQLKQTAIDEITDYFERIRSYGLYYYYCQGQCQGQGQGHGQGQGSSQGQGQGGQQGHSGQQGQNGPNEHIGDSANQDISGGAEDYSETNNQVSGVDEGDFIKTDGRHIYLLHNNQLLIFGTPTVGEIIPESNLTIRGTPQQMLLHRDKLIVISRVNVNSFPSNHPMGITLTTSHSGLGGGWSNEATQMTIIDISDRTNPEVSREFIIEGQFSTTRSIDGGVRIVTRSIQSLSGLNYNLNFSEEDFLLLSDERYSEWDIIFNRTIDEKIAENRIIISAMSIDNFLPTVHAILDHDSVVSSTHRGRGCVDDISVNGGLWYRLTSIWSLDLSSESSTLQGTHIEEDSSYGMTIYANKEVFVLAQQVYRSSNHGEYGYFTKLNIVVIRGTTATEHVSQGVIPGWIIDQFALDEKDGTIYAASSGRERYLTESGYWRWTQLSSGVYVMHNTTGPDGEGLLRIVGEVSGIAAGEQLWSTRFVGDEAYLVTFRRTDPLWTIDLTDDTNPQVKGELEVPGVSTYIHPLEGKRLLTVGYGGSNTGLDWSTQVSLFDVTNASDPRLDSSLSLSLSARHRGNGWEWSFSEALGEHKAFQWWASEGLLALPLSTWRSEVIWDTNLTWHYQYQHISQLVLVKVTDSGGLVEHGRIDQSGFYDDDANVWYGRTEVRRSIFMDDHIYAIGTGGITTARLTDLSTSASFDIGACFALLKAVEFVQSARQFEGEESVSADISFRDCPVESELAGDASDGGEGEGEGDGESDGGVPPEFDIMEETVDSDTSSVNSTSSLAPFVSPSSSLVNAPPDDDQVPYNSGEESFEEANRIPVDMLIDEGFNGGHSADILGVDAESVERDDAVSNILSKLLIFDFILLLVAVKLIAHMKHRKRI